MEKDNSGEKARLKRAQLRVKKIKGFYKHLTVFLIVNTLLLLMKVIGNSYYGETFMGPCGTSVLLVHGYYGEQVFFFME